MSGARLSATDVAKLAGITPSAVRLYKSRGRIPPCGDDGRWDESTIHTWLRTRPGEGRPRSRKLDD